MSKDYTRLRPHWRPTHDTNPTGFDRWIGPDGPNGWVKILNPDGHHVRRVWEVAPEAQIVLRNHAISEQKAEMLADPIGTARAHAHFWMEFLRSQSLWEQRHRLALEGINEAAVWEDGVLDALVRYSVEFIVVLCGWEMVPVALQMNTGWPTNHGVKDAPPDWTPFEPVRDALLRYGGYLGLHEYWDIRGPNSSDWGWNPGRFTQLPDSWRGIPILITECGYDEAVNAPAGTKNHGYIGKMHPGEYLEQLCDYDQKVRESGWDVHACFIFTHDWDEPWGTFDTRPITNQIARYAEAVRLDDIPVPVSPSPPQPVSPTVPPTTNGEGPEVFVTLFTRSGGQFTGKVPQGAVEYILPHPGNAETDAVAIILRNQSDDYKQITAVDLREVIAVEYEDLE